MEFISIQGRNYRVEGYVRTNVFKKPVPVLGIRMMEDRKAGAKK